MEPLVVGISGASGIILGIKLIDALAAAHIPIECTMTEAAALTLHEESPHIQLETHIQSLVRDGAKITLHDNSNLSASIASGSFLTRGMIIAPCSMHSLAAISTGIADSLLRRAADVTIKEKRPLILVPRETPLSEIHLEHMLRLARLGAVILPPVPAWYTRPKTIEDVENFIIGKILDALKLPHTLYPRWRA